MQFRVKLFPVAEMIYDRYKDLHLEGNKAVSYTHLTLPTT